MEKDIITESFLLVSEKNLRIEKRSLEQLQKRGASPNVIAEQQKVVSELTEKYEEAKAATERIQKQLGLRLPVCAGKLRDGSRISFHPCIILLETKTASKNQGLGAGKHAYQVTF